MQLTRRDVLVMGGASVALAGCTGNGEPTPTEDDLQDDNTEDNGPGTPTPDDAGSDDGTDATTPSVQVSSHSELGDILVDAEGMTLYMFDQDTQGDEASTCYDGCAETWPPLTVDGEPTAGDDVTAELDSFERETGEPQVMADGWPLYYFASDEEPGDAAGQGINDVWWVLAPDGSPITSNDETANNNTY